MVITLLQFAEHRSSTYTCKNTTFIDSLRIKRGNIADKLLLKQKKSNDVKTDGYIADEVLWVYKKLSIVN